MAILRGQRYGWLAGPCSYRNGHRQMRELMSTLRLLNIEVRQARVACPQGVVHEFLRVKLPPYRYSTNFLNQLIVPQREIFSEKSAQNLYTQRCR